MFQRALIIDHVGSAILIPNYPIPDPAADEILIRTEAVALNPIDFKVIDKFGTPGSLLGCDYAGVVEKIGSKVKKKFRIGDRVAGMAQGGNNQDARAGAFAEYILAIGDVQFLIPASMQSLEAAALGTALNTATQSLYQHLRLSLPAQSANPRISILVYGGATSIGTMTIQFAKLSCLTVVTTCSPENFAMVKEYGADAAFDYHDPNCGQQIRDFTGNCLTLVIDCISKESSMKICCTAMGSQGGIYLSTRAAIKELPRSDIRLISMIAFTALGKPFNIVPDAPIIGVQKEHRALAESFVPMVEDLLQKGEIKAHPYKIGELGLRGVLHGVDLLRREEIHGVKLVYRIADTV